MSTIAADTWGIPGPTFAGLYAVLVVVVATVVLVARRRVGAHDTAPTTSLTPTEVAYLRGGDGLAVATALGQLRAAGSLDDHARPVGTTTVSKDPVETALLGVLRDTGRPASRHVTALANHTHVRTALRRVRDDLTARGFRRTRAEQAQVGRWSLLLWAVFGLGVVRVLAGTSNDKPVGIVTFETVVAFVAAVAATVPSTAGAHPAARAAIAETTRANAHLAPSLHPSWSTYGATGAGMSIALFGASAMLLAEPAFADTVAVKQLAPSSGGSSGGDSGGSSCSSGCGGGCGG